MLFTSKRHFVFKFLDPDCKDPVGIFKHKQFIIPLPSVQFILFRVAFVSNYIVCFYWRIYTIKIDVISSYQQEKPWDLKRKKKKIKEFRNRLFVPFLVSLVLIFLFFFFHYPTPAFGTLCISPSFTHFVNLTLRETYLLLFFIIVSYCLRFGKETQIS